MKIIKSELQKAQELVDLINKDGIYKAKLRSGFTKLIFANGETIKVGKSFWNHLDIVFNENNINYFTIGNLNKFEIGIIKKIEELSNKEVLIKDEAEITFGGR